MSTPDNDARKHEIIIVRRRDADEEDGHHGGAWKIAFADFMTAMMCFFLVMWLINAANEQTRSALASYFNPVKLIDRNTSRKGLEEIGQGPQSADTRDESSAQTSDTPAGRENETSGPMSFQDATDSAETRRLSDENLFSDPYAVLAEIAADTGIRQNVSEKGDGGAQTSGPASGASGGESYRDPFAPDFWSQQVELPEAAVAGDPGEAQEEQAVIEVAEKSRAEEEPGVQRTEPEDTARQEDLEESAEEIREALAARFAGDPLAGSVAVEVGEDGVIVSITDDIDNGMFPVGSAVPLRTLVLAMDKIGDVLSRQAGKIKIKGHTDGRPFRSDAYDNWRLSTARAHAAQYMLVRGGVDETRIAEVSGFADRDLKIPSDPYDSANRRIEILLELPR